MAAVGRARLLGLALLIGVLASGCEVRLATEVVVAEDGSGTVTAGLGLDDEALTTVGDLAASLAVDDLVAAGWTVRAPAKEADGLTWMRLSQPFSSVAEANVILQTLSGQGGPFAGLEVSRTRSWRRTETSLRGRIDLTAGLAGLSDDALAAKLAQFGFDPGLGVEGLRRRFGDDLGASVKVQLSADLPGKVESNASPGSGNRAVWTGALGQETLLVANAELTRFPVKVAVAGAAAVGTAGALLLLVWRRRRHRAWR